MPPRYYTLHSTPMHNCHTPCDGSGHLNTHRISHLSVLARQAPVEPIRDREGLQTCRLPHRNEPGATAMQVRTRPRQDRSRRFVPDQLKITLSIKFVAGDDVIENVGIVNKNGAARFGRRRRMSLKHLERIFTRHGGDEPRPISVGRQGHFR